MVDTIETAYVELWGQVVGAVAWLPEQGHAAFEFSDEFLRSGLDIAPITMPLADALQGERIFSFPSLSPATFMGLPGLLADCLPDKFGNAIIDAWLARQGRSGADFSPVERLCYMGRRGMGALEFRPALERLEQAVPVEIAALVEIAQNVTLNRAQFATRLSGKDSENSEALADILRVGTSAGGARPKAIIAMNQQGDVRSGQVEAPRGFDYWLIKFDGVNDLELGAPSGFGRIEYAYYEMAKAADIEISESRLLEENGRAHFLTRRFDRDAKGGKIHMLSLCGIAHFDFNLAGAYSYEQCFGIMRALGLPKSEAVEQFKRMVFNVLARNQDDHTKNIAFLMDQSGEWRLAPAYDLTYAHNPKGLWTNQHQMSINGKRDDFTLRDLETVGESIGIKKPADLIKQVADAVARWPEFAKHAGVKKMQIDQIAEQHRRLI